MSAPDRRWDPTFWLHLSGIAVLSAGYEWQFIHNGLNPVDEGWPLHAARGLIEGGTLYREVFFVFPPGHLLPAWIAAQVAPPGVVGTRILYAAFNVALCVSLYALGRRLMPAPFALLGAALVAVASANSHLQQLLFGYRYLFWSCLALIAFAWSFRSGRGSPLVLAGALTGVALGFRLTPALSVAAAMGVGLLAGRSSWSERLRDAALLATGFALVVAPLLAWGLSTVGAEVLWREIVVRPVAMTALQTRPVPDLAWPANLDRQGLSALLVAFLFRAIALLYLGYALALAFGWVRSLRAGRPFGPVLLLTVVAWGAIYYFRSLGRADEPHLMSALPPACLLFAHLLSLGTARLEARGPDWARRKGLQAVALAAVFALWAFFSGSDRAFDPGFVGSHPVRALDGRVSVRPGHWWVDARVDAIRRLTEPGDRLLVLGPESLLYVLADRPSLGGADVLMPGTFLTEAEELAFLDRVRRDPPALVLRPQLPFDMDPSRAIARTAPNLVRWVEDHYELRGDPRRYGVWMPRR